MNKLKAIFLVTLFCQFTKTTLAQVPATWTVNPSAYTYQMSATTKANEACIDLIDANNYVAAFVGVQCRGVIKTNTPIGPNLLGLMTIKSNVVSGEKVSFKIYKASTNSVLNVLDSVVFSQGATFGTLSNPFTLYTNHRPTDISIGTYMVNENTPLATVMSSLSAADLDAGTIFTYSLTAAQTENMQFGISGSNLTVNSLFDYETDSIKIIQLEVDDNGGCKFAETFTLHILNINETPTFNPGQYSNTMSAVIAGNICNDALDNGNVAIGAFDNINTLRGYAYPIAVNNTYMFFLTLYSNSDGESLDIKYFNTTDGSVASTNTVVIFVTDAIVGTPSAPFMANVDDSLACPVVDITTAVNQLDNTTNINVYPNPFEDDLALTFNKVVSAKVELVDVLGKVVYSSTIKDKKEFNIATKLNIAVGMYHILLTGDVNQQIKVIKTK